MIFDIGGVLERNPPTGWQRKWARRLGRDPREVERELNRILSPGSIGAVSLEEIMREAATVLGLDHAAVSALMEDSWREYVGTLNSEMAGYFAGLRARYKTGILSNSFVGAREREQAAYGFEDMCDEIVYSHEVGCLKPEPKIYHLACERLNVAPQAAVFLDDVPANVDGGRRVGMRAIDFIDTDQAIAAVTAALWT